MPNSSFAGAALARRARELFLSKAVDIMGESAQAVRQRLNALLDESSNARQSQDRRDAWLQYQKCESSWVNATAVAWKKAATPATASVRMDLNALTFELVGNDVVENKILASRLSLRILDKATWELNDLMLRIRKLENTEDIDKQDVLRPEACAQLVVEAWIAAGLTQDAWLSVQEVMHRAFAERMVEAYHDVNAFLVENGVMAEIDLRQLVRRTPGANTGNTGAVPFEQTVQSPLGSSPGYRPMAAGAELKGGGSGGGSMGSGSAARGSSGASATGFGGAQGGMGGPGGFGGAGGSGQGGGSAGAMAAARAGLVRGGAGNAAGQNGMPGAQPGNTGGFQAGAQAGSSGAPGASRPAGQAGNFAPQNAGAGAGGAQNGTARPGRAAVARYAEESHEETRMMTSATPLARAKMRAQGVMGQLKRMLIDKVAGFDDTRSYAPSPQLAAAMAPRAGTGYARTQQGSSAGGMGGGGAGVGMGGGGGGGGGVAFAGFAEGMRPEQAAGALRDESTALKKAASTSAEKATIEIVALMFQSILAEDRIPAPVRVWFARLQMPVLRLALSEPEFFGSLQHPARRLIDRMGSCVLGFEGEVSSVALETEVKRVVQVIEQYPETGRRVFQLVYDEFQKFLSRFLVEGAATQRVVSVAQQMEQKETNAIQFTIELRKMLGNLPMRDEIREFLFKVWAEVLAIAAMKDGPQHADTINLKQVAADLVWAASAKPNRADRAKVIQDLPNLLKRLRSGMSLLGFDAAKQDGHIKVISDTLADAFMSKTETIDPKQIEEMSKRLKNLEDFVSEDDVGDLPLDAESIELMLGIDTSGIDIITTGGSDPTEAMRGWAMELDEGSWFNLDHNGNVARVQYAWRSQRGQLHLFASTNGRTYLFQVRRLAAYLQAGLVTPVEDEALTVRATRDAMSKIDANPERLLG
jgi:Protein of unknown function (DUF1631)